jgi:hypothetical protein
LYLALPKPIEAIVRTTFRGQTISAAATTSSPSKVVVILVNICKTRIVRPGVSNKSRVSALPPAVAFQAKIMVNTKVQTAKKATNHVRKYRFQAALMGRPSTSGFTVVVSNDEYWCSVFGGTADARGDDEVG